MRDMQITVGTYPCGSMSIVVCASGVRIHDTRQSRPDVVTSHRRGHDSSVFLAIGSDWHDASSNLVGEEDEPAHSHRPQHLWGQVSLACFVERDDDASSLRLSLTF